LNFSDIFEQLELIDDRLIEALDEVATLRETVKEVMINGYKNATPQEVPEVQKVHSEEKRSQVFQFSDGSSVAVQVLRVPIYGKAFKLSAPKTQQLNQ
jgi:hypothetical protein